MDFGTDFWGNNVPFLRPASQRPADIWTDGLFELLRSRGLDSFSVSALARQLEVTPSAVLQRRSRQDLLQDVVITFGRRWLDWSVPPLFGPAIPGSLPRTEHERRGVRCWQAMQEVAQGAAAAGDPKSLAHIRWVREEETGWTEFRLGRLLDRDPTTSEVTMTLVLLDGLRSDLTAPNPRLTADEATQVLLDHVQGLRELPG